MNRIFVVNFVLVIFSLILNSNWVSTTNATNITNNSNNNSILSSSSFTASNLSSSVTTTTPIKHLVIYVPEDISFDHYFGTYPNATNPPGEPKFIASPDTPKVNGLNSTLLYHNPNLVNPFRYDRSANITCAMDHHYTPEQSAIHGNASKYVEYASAKAPDLCTDFNHQKQVMGYYDGNTVTALWNYAQHFAMSDNFFGTTYGPSLLGHVNLISGQTNGAVITNPIPPNETEDNDGYAVINGTLIANKYPANDDCSYNRVDNPTYSVIEMKGRNIGNLLNDKNVTWGWFSDGFTPSKKTADGKWHCTFEGILVNHIYQGNNSMLLHYYSDVEPFQYYKNTSNPHHLPPYSISNIGHTDQANHQYDISHFWAAGESGNLPAVSFIKPPTYADGHAGFSNPLDEQQYLVETINHIENLPQWNETAIIIAYDDSGAWYDHVIPPIVGSSKDSKFDRITDEGKCGNVTSTEGPFQNRCGYGPRLPMLIVSPWAKMNYVDHNLTDQTSITKFIEDNWNLGRIGNNSYDEKAGSILNMFNFTGGYHNSKLYLDPVNGTRITK